MIDALKLHHDALVVDGLVYHCDGDVADLRAGGVDALNVTTCHFEADFPQACSEIARWHGTSIDPTPRGCRLRRRPISRVPRPKAELVSSWVYKICDPSPTNSIASTCSGGSGSDHAAYL